MHPATAARIRKRFAVIDRLLAQSLSPESPEAAPEGPSPFEQSMTSGQGLHEFMESYKEAMAWSTVDDGSPGYDEHSGDGPSLLDGLNDGSLDWSDEAIAQIRQDCQAFYQKHEGDIEGNYIGAKSGDYSDAEMAGYDFWMTRTGSGVGFWDGDWSEPAASAMDETSKKMGEQWPYSNEGLIYL